MRTESRKQQKPPPKKRIWKLQKPEVQEKNKKAVEESINSSILLSDPDSEADVKLIWTEIKSCLVNASDFAGGWAKGNYKQERKAWRWDDTVESLVKQKKNYGRSGRKEVAKRNICRQKGKQNQVYMLPKENARRKNLISWKVVIKKFHFQTS